MILAVAAAGIALFVLLTIGMLLFSSPGPRSSSPPARPTLTAQEKAKLDAAAAAAKAEGLTLRKKWLATKAGRIWQKHQDWSEADCETLAEGKISMGMSAAQVRVGWGQPTDVHRTTGSWGVHEQWCYGEYCRSAVYLENGVVSSIQN